MSDISDLIHAEMNLARKRLRESKSLMRAFVRPKFNNQEGLKMQDPTDKEFLQWLYDRMKNIYREVPGLDFMRRLKSIIDKMED